MGIKELVTGVAQCSLAPCLGLGLASSSKFLFLFIRVEVTLVPYPPPFYLGSEAKFES